jgi:hypothetical protein
MGHHEMIRPSEACGRCGHPEAAHAHYRRGSECSHVFDDAEPCPCSRWIAPPAALVGTRGRARTGHL